MSELGKRNKQTNWVKSKTSENITSSFPNSLIMFSNVSLLEGAFVLIGDAESKNRGQLRLQLFEKCLFIDSKQYPLDKILVQRYYGSEETLAIISIRILQATEEKIEFTLQYLVDCGAEDVACKWIQMTQALVAKVNGMTLDSLGDDYDESWVENCKNVDKFVGAVKLQLWLRSDAFKDRVKFVRKRRSIISIQSIIRQKL